MEQVPPDSGQRAEEEEAAAPVSISIEKGDEGRYTVRTKDLAFIASQLRGKKSFSVYTSIILPMLAVLGTTLLTTAIASLFQYVSWRNSTKLQEAADRASRATKAYEAASIAIGRRYYSTFLYLAAVRDLANLKPTNTRLYELNVELNKHRFEAYFEQLRDWNERYDQILTEIDFSMDRPAHIVEHVSKPQLAKIDCRQTLIEQLNRHGMNGASLKVQFAAINRCLSIATAEFSGQRDKAIVDQNFVVDERIKGEANDALNDVNGMANEFRCHSLFRIQYFNQLKDEAIFKPGVWLKARLGNWEAGEGRPKGFDRDAALAQCGI
jgi:hypothetical protein